MSNNQAEKLDLTKQEAINELQDIADTLSVKAQYFMRWNDALEPYVSTNDEVAHIRQLRVTAGLSEAVPADWVGGPDWMRE